ncbi:MAG: beta-ketoacyl-[acyl-carrier-protein] synthase family protein [Bacillati bacterium ANGP1]|uniref:Beta-ketoacyl-[acyl-carrier-protein] synthase family protein n=1 Tax=Candidatus Segetimicrobium genomatis TaxID=2569760 RepID=A0A537KBK9_9BACT|nr:MAG: beta-ketoacyl-[acyl-carrier-protein] synthase family protein [Terrabacteria group bacterium ANGP1]
MGDASARGVSLPRVLVTGLGSVSALGENTAQLWDGLLAGRTGIKPVANFRQEHLRNVLAGEIRLSAAQREYAQRYRLDSRIALFAHMAIDEALKDAAWAPVCLHKKKVGLVLGTSLGMSLVEKSIDQLDECGGEQVDTYDDFAGVVEELADAYRVSGEALIVTTACAAGTNAIGIAKDMIRHEGYEVVICGGVDTLDRMKYLGHSALNTLTPTLIRPFTPERDGTLFGEGAGILVLERESLAQDHSAYAACAGAGYSCDAHHITGPDPSGAGAVKVMGQALGDAGIRPQDVDHINLHGSGTPLNDRMEYAAIRDLFGPAAERIPVSSIKPAIGHVMGAAGALEAIATVLSLRDQKVPPTLNVAAPDPELPLNLVCGEARMAAIEHALSNSFGFGGCNGAVIFSRVNAGPGTDP